MESANTLHSVRDKKRELRLAQRENKKKVDKMKEVRNVFLLGRNVCSCHTVHNISG